MSVADTSAVRRQSIRVALAATFVVAIAYLAIASAIVAFATRDLTAQVDARLTEALHRLPPPGMLGALPGDGPPSPGRDPVRPYGAPFLVWIVRADGTVLSDSATPTLAENLRAATAPETATIDGTEMRVAGQDFSGDRIVVAQSMDLVGDAQRTIALGILLVAPFLLGSVFVGAVIIGRRVAAPIEAARRRQLEFTADASHELRTPLSVIEAHTSLALAAERDAAWYRTAFASVDRESTRMRRLLEDMLWLARFDAAAAPSSAEPVDLGVLATQVADRFAPIAETRDLALSVHVPQSQVLIAASPELVDRLIGVLLDNACKYSPEGGTVDVTVAVDANRASVTVDDSGPGIPADEQDRVFDRFHRSITTSTGASGAGLGLAIGDAIVRATSARWHVATSPAGGARFSVSWNRVSLA